jgi:hypothetical protein
MEITARRENLEMRNVSQSESMLVKRILPTWLLRDGVRGWCIVGHKSDLSADERAPNAEHPLTPALRHAKSCLGKAQGDERV